MSFRARSIARRPLCAALSLALSALALTACGGGGSDTPSASATLEQGVTPVTPAPAATSAPAPVAPVATPTSTPTTTATGPIAKTKSTFVTSATPAPGYYVDPYAGNDANPGTMDQPFQTFARLLKLRLQPGEGIYLHCGSVFRDRLNLGATQLVDGSIVSNYGDNCDTNTVRITGADDFSGGWTLNANGIWSRPVPAGTPKIARLFINGNPLRTAQWPNDDGTGNKYALTSSTSGVTTTNFNVSAADLAFLATQDLVGATALNQTQPWTVESRTISAFSPSTGLVTFASPTVNATRANQGYVLTDKQWMLDVEDEFFHDTANNMLYVKPEAALTTAGLNNQRVEGAVRDNAVTLGGRAGLQVSNLIVDMARVDGLVINDSPNAQLQNLRVNHHARAGLRVFSNTYVTGTDRNAQVTNSVFADNALFGVDATNSNRVTLSNDTITDTGTRAWAGTSVAAAWVADGGIVDSSVVQRSAYAGVRFSGTDGTRVSNNDVTGYCLRLADCAGIYTWNGPKGSQKTVNQVSSVTGNRVGPAAGFPSGVAVAGIYLDDFSQGATVDGNTIGSAPYGIIVHNGSHHVISHNRAWLNPGASLWMNMDQSDADYMTANTISSNEFAPVGSASGTYPALPKYTYGYGLMYLTTQASVTGGGNTFTGNSYLALQGGAMPMVLTRTSSGNQTWSTGRWHQVAPNDGSRVTPARFGLLALTQGAELQLYGGFDTGLTKWWAWYAPPGTGSLTALTSGTGCTGGCAAFASASANDNFYGASFKVTSGALYVTRFTAGFDAYATIIPPYMSAAASPNPSIVASDGLAFSYPVDGGPGDVVDAETFFHASSTVSARTNLKVRTAGVPVKFDNVSVTQVSGYWPVDTRDWGQAVLSPSSAATTVSCATFGWPDTCTMLDGETGQQLTLPVTVPAGSSRLLVRGDSPVRRP